MTKKLLFPILTLLLFACQPRLSVEGKFEGNLTHQDDRLEFQLQEKEGDLLEGSYRLRYYSQAEPDLRGKITGRLENNTLFLEFERPGKDPWKGEGYLSERPFTEQDKTRIDRLIGPRRDGDRPLPPNFFDGITQVKTVDMSVMGAENHKFSSHANTLVPELRKRLHQHFN